MKKTPNMKITSIGLIPEDWDVLSISAVGQDFSYGVGAEAVPFNGQDKYIRITDIDDESHRYNPNPVTSPSYYFENHILKENDIVVARTGASVGKSYLYNHRDGKLVFAGFLMKFNVPNLDARYVAYHLSTRRYWQWVNSESARTGQPGLNIQQLKQFSFQSPTDLKEQQKISDALSCVDDMIGALDEAIAKKRQIKEGLMQQLLMPGKNGEWVERLGRELYSIGNGRDYKCLKPGRIPVYGTGGLMAFVDEYLHDGPTVCIGRKGTIDKPQYHEGKIWTVDTLFYTYDFRGVDPKFLYYLFCRVNWHSLNEATGVPSLTSNSIMNVSFLLPLDKKEQDRIVSILDAAESEIQALENKRNKYTLIKQGMMQVLLTGKIRLI